MKVRLRVIEVVNFCRSEATNYQALSKTALAQLERPTDAACLIAMSFNQLAFVLRSGGYGEWMSIRYRLRRGTIDTARIADYGAEVGLEFVGLPRLREKLKK